MLQPLEFDLLYFVFISIVLAFIWWWCCWDHSIRCTPSLRPTPAPDAAEVARQEHRDTLTRQLQEDLRELRQQRRQQQLMVGPNGVMLLHGDDLEPATAEEMAKLQWERRKQIQNQLAIRNYTSTSAVAATTAATTLDHDEEEAAATTATTAAAGAADATDPYDCEQHEGVCNICLNEFQEGDQVSDALNPECRHFFHTECVVDWLLRNRICPICRRDFLLPAAISPPPPQEDVVG
jgi:hypothetical protein